MSDLLTKIKDKSARVAILGLGYVGLPLAVAFAQAGFNVTGIDSDPRKVEALCRGQSYIKDVPDEALRAVLETGRLAATTVMAVLRDAEAVSICVPTPLRKTGDPDLSYILAATEALGRYVHAGMLVVLESTTYPGTTREILLPRLAEAHGLTAGKNFFLAFSPERVDPGRQDWTTLNTPKVMGGITPACTDMAAALYAQALQTVVPVSSSEVAEMAKLLENTFRMINIGLANEMALMCDRLGVDVWEVIEAAASKPFGFMKFTPGPGLGGHCIPIDPLYLSWKPRGLQYTARFIELAAEINSNMPRHVVNKVQDALNEQGKALKGSRVLVLGAAYKADIDDLRESPALDVIGLLLQKGAQVGYHDPYVAHLKHDGWELESEADYLQAARQADCVVIVTDHSCYDYAALLEAARCIVDTRNALGAAAIKELIQGYSREK
jgi:UDP-N-acetyl-D-glucosamine dehydrogenase